MRRLAGFCAAALLGLALLTGCQAAPQGAGWSEEEPSGQLELDYATQFTVDEYPDGCRLVTIGGTDQYLVVPEGVSVPSGVPEEITVLQQPLDQIYLVATSAMDLFRSLDGLDSIRLSGTNADGWYIPEARQAMEAGDILYAGKYNAPDYELILSEGCDLAVESTMINHNPEVKEQLQRLGVPVLVERSSYEANPLGRMEWVKLYGVLLGREEEAATAFDQAAAAAEALANQPSTGKTVAFFYINSMGTVNVRKTGDYVAEMIRMAGGTYLPDQPEENANALSTMNMDMESFYQSVRDADVLIYNSTIDGGLDTLDQLLDKSPLLADFKAVQEGNVWCTGQNMFQESMALGDMIGEFHRIFTEEDPQGLAYLHRLT